MGEAGEALARTDGIAVGSHGRNGDASASALARVRGYALALLGRASAQGPVDESLRAARGYCRRSPAAGHKVPDTDWLRSSRPNGGRRRPEAAPKIS